MVTPEEPALWLHPGVSNEQRQSLIKEVFSKITINGKDFISIEPKPVYAPLFATMLLDKKLGYCGREPPPSPPLYPYNYWLIYDRKNKLS